MVVSGGAVGKLMTHDLSGMTHSKSQKLDLSGSSLSMSMKLGLQARGSKGIGKLPEELLAKILGILDPKMLMAARLVCRAFRAASIPCITALRYPSQYVQDPSPSRDLACRLQVFTSVCTLDLGLNLLSDPYFFEAPGVLSVLRRLRLSWLEMELCAEDLRHLPTTLAAATQLTPLEISGEFCEVPGFGIPLAQCLGAYTALRDLSLGVCDYHQHTVWEGLLGKSAQFSRLEALGSVVLYGKADFEAVAALTQLTRLSLDVRSGETQHLTLLSSLTTLQSLHVADGSRRYEPIMMQDVYELVERMPQLRELDLDAEVWDGDMERTVALVASLPAITSFKSVFFAEQGEVWESHCPVGLSKLRELSIPLAFSKHASPLCTASIPPPLGWQVASFSAALTGLETLEIACEPRDCYLLFSQLPPMKCLTRLFIGVEGRDKVHTAFTPGCFLMGLPRLRSLELQNVLDARRWQDDARYVAALTELTELVMYFFGCELEEDVSNFTLAQVQPLTTLTQLNSLRISEPWASGMACPEFQQALNGPRHQMGLPPVCLVLDGIWNMFGSC
eukprot:jgi/Botrbrau1/13271/Bobra.0074s0019.1